jgi:hypothetical protein
MVPMMSTDTQMWTPSRTYSNAFTFLIKRASSVYPAPSTGVAYRALALAVSHDHYQNPTT